MPKIIVANVDSDAMCGTDMSPEILALSSMSCCRLVALAGDDDLVVVPHSVSDEFLGYVNEVLGRNLSARNVVVPRDGDTKQLILNDESMNDGFVADEIRRRAGGDLTGWTLEAYFLDRPAIALAEELGLDTSGHSVGFLRSGGAETYNSKVLFRQLAEACGAPIAEGRIAGSERELGRAIGELLGVTGRVMIKQDMNSGSAGNTCVTTFGETQMIGAYYVENVTPDVDPYALAAKIWPNVAVQRNTRVVVEAYHKSTQVHYSELWVYGPGKAPWLMNFGEMRMEPTFCGFEIPCQRLAAFDIGEMAAHSMNLAREAGDRGFTGYMNIDSILRADGGIMFTEVNGRMGCCTHIDYWARQLLGDQYGTNHVVLTKNWIHATDFPTVLKALDDAGVLYSPDTKSGVVLPIEDTAISQCIDYMVIADDYAQALDIERRALVAMGIDPDAPRAGH